MPNKRKISISLASVAKLAQSHLNWGVYLITILVIGWLGYFIYTKIYTVTVNPKPLDPSEILARRQKVDVSRFNVVIERLEDKQKARVYQTPENPFDN